LYFSISQAVTLTVYRYRTYSADDKAPCELINETTKISGPMYLTIHIEEEEEATLLSVPLPVSLRQLEFAQHRPVLHVLEHRRRKPAGTTLLGLLHQVMLEHGWRRQRPYDRDSDQDAARCEPQSPGVNDYRLYNVLAVDARALERVVQRGERRFDIEQCMRAYCRQYQVRRAKTFPSLRHDIAQHGALMERSKHAVSARAQRTARDNKRRHQDNDDEGAFIYDNAFINVPGATDEETTETRAEVPRRGQKRAEVAAAEEQWTRLIPVAVLPLLLPLLPPCYTRANEILYECEQLEQRLWRQFTTMAQYPRYVMAQVDALASNRRHVARLHQQSHLAQRAKAESRLHEDELLHLRLEHATTIEAARREIARLRARQNDGAAQFL
jgi:hypothetical protein